MKKYLIALCMILIASSVYAEDHPATGKPVVTTQLTDSIYMLQGKGGECWCVCW